jgi:cobalt-zinc-cadmium resistance protein CzcA
MLQKIIAFSVKQKLLVGLGVFALLAVGIYELGKLPIDAVPDITDNQVQLITVAPSMGATDIERLITVPVEQANRNIPGLKNLRSFSRFGLSIVTLVFDEDVSVYWARQQVSERLTSINAQIPAGISPPTMAPITTGLGEIYQYVLRPEKGYEKQWTPTELRTLQDWVVRKQLLGVKGVADVSSYGGFQKQYEVALDPSQMQSFHIGINEVFDALQKENANTGGSYIEKGPQALFVRTEGLLTNVDEIGSVVVNVADDGTPILIRDLAKIQEGSSTRYGALCYNDQGEVAGAVVMMLKGANSNEVVKAVKSKVEEIQVSLPKGVKMEAFLDRTKMVNNAIGTVEKNLAEGALIVVIVLVLALGSFRAGFVVASVIPLAMLFAVIMMNLFGVSGNLMSLGALDFGLIIDGAVIIVESVLHQLWKKDGPRYSADERDSVVTQNAGRMMNSAVFGQLIILVVYLPIFSLQGIEGKMFKPMAQTVAFALMGAFILSLTYVPMMCSYFLPKHPGKGQAVSERVMIKIENRFAPLLKWAIQNGKFLLIGAVAVLLISFVAFAGIGGEFIPQLEEGDFAADTRIMTGSSVKASVEYTQKASRILLQQFPEVEKVVTKIGNGEIPTDPMPMEASDMMIILKDKSEWKSAETFPELAEKMSLALKDIPGLTVGFQFPVQMRFNELMTGAKQDVVCKIYGPNMDTLARLASVLGGIVNRVEGAKDLYVEQVSGQPQIVVKYNRSQMALHGIRTESLNKAIETAFAGAAAGKVFEEERRFDLTVRLNNGSRNDIEDVMRLPIKSETGQLVPLSQLSEVSLQEGPNQIQRDNAQRRITVGFNVRGADVQTVVEVLQKKVGKSLRLPAGYTLGYGGSFENLQSAKTRLFLAIPVALLLIWILLYFAFGSIQYSVIIFSAIPMSLIGGIWGLLLRGMPFSISAGIGMIALFGVAVLNGIVLMAEFKRHGNQPNLDALKEMVTKSTLTRLRPVLMTALVAALGFMPMALSHGAGAEVQKPLATVVIGGLITATLLTLLLLPALFIMIENRKMKKNHKFNNPDADGLAVGGVVKSVLVILLMLGLAGDSNNLFAKSATVNRAVTLPSPMEYNGAMNISPALDSMRMSIQDVLEAATTKSALMRSMALQTASSDAIAKTKVGLDPTGLTYEGGQVNSWYKDQKLTFSQGFQMPHVYAREHQQRLSAAEVVHQMQSMKEVDVKQAVATLYYHMQHTQEQFPLWQMMDSLAKENLRMMQLKFSQGDVGGMELNQSKKMSADMHMMLETLVYQFERDAMELAIWAGRNGKVYPTVGGLDFPLPTKSTSIPILAYSKSMTDYGLKDWKLAQAKRLPSFQLGYVQQSFQGYQQLPSGDQYFGKNLNFSQYQVSMRLPLAGGLLKNNAKAASLQYQSLLKHQEFVEQQVDLQMHQMFDLEQQLRLRVLLYREELLPMATSQISLIQIQWKAGEISGLEWGLYMREALQTQIDYYDVVHQWETVQIQILYFNPSIK